MLFTILFSALVTALVLMLAFPKTPTARAIHRALVEAPARLVFDLTWAKAGRYALLTPVFFLLILAGPEMMLMFAAMGADAAALELMIVLWAVSVSGGLAGAWRTVSSISGKVLRLVRRTGLPTRRPRASRPRRKSRPQDRNDDASGPDWAFA